MTRLVAYWQNTKWELTFLLVIATVLVLYFGYDITWPLTALFVGSTICQIILLLAHSASLKIAQTKKTPDAR